MSNNNVTQKRKGDIKILLTTAVILSVCLSVYYLAYIEPYIGGYVEPSIRLNVEKNGSEYIIKIIEIERGKPKLWLSLENFDAMVSKGEQLLDNPESFLVHVSLTEIINNEMSNITFYDNDDNMNLSIGDIFVVQGALAMDGNWLSLHSHSTGHLFSVKFRGG